MEASSKRAAQQAPHHRSALNGANGTVVSKDPDELVAFKQDWKELMRAALGLEGGRSGHVMKYFYSSLGSPSGAKLWDNLVKYDKDYYIPADEADIIQRHEDYFDHLFGVRDGKIGPVMIDLGPGGIHSVNLKSIPTAEAVRASAYVAIDYNSKFAEDAAALMNQTLGIEAWRDRGDFTKRVRLQDELQEIIGDAPILMTMFGCTLSQFPFKQEPGGTGEATFHETLKNLGEMTGFNSILLATIDANLDSSSAERCYRDEHVNRWYRHIWMTAKLMIESSHDKKNNYVLVDGDAHANPADFVAHLPRYENGRIAQSYMTRVPMTFVIDGEKFRLPKGTEVVAAPSEKWSVPRVIEGLKGTGFTLVNDLTVQGSTVHALVLAGKNVSQEQIERASQTLEAIAQSKREVLNSSRLHRSEKILSAPEEPSRLVKFIQNWMPRPALVQASY